jgi:hypothetical protein
MSPSSILLIFFKVISDIVVQRYRLLQKKSSFKEILYSSEGRRRRGSCCSFYTSCNQHEEINQTRVPHAHAGGNGTISKYVPLSIMIMNTFDRSEENKWFWSFFSNLLKGRRAGGNTIKDCNMENV